MLPAVTMVLPRERHTVPAARALLEKTLARASVAADDVADLSVALSEACSNAVRHAEGAASYRVEIVVDDEGCTIEVADEGTGFHGEVGPDGHGPDMPPPDDEGGRGLALMDALVDRCELTADQGVGARVRLFKRLSPGRTRSFPGSGAGYGRAHDPNEEEAHG